VVCNTPATLVYLANQACLTPHLWLSQVDQLDYPDKLIFDLDPPADDFEPVRFAARALRDRLQELELDTYVMTTGSQGLHVVIPLDRKTDFDTARSFAREFVEYLAQQHPERLTTEVRKNKRKGRVFLDYLRNAYGQTAVSPYAVRAKAGAPVATPLEWAELGDSDLHAQSYTISNIFRRLGQKNDPWAGMRQHAQSLTTAQKQLKSFK
jgi:bifunctional non-homologous end joining protein LigD